VIAGHFGFAAAVKAKTPSTPLWALMLACQWLDVVFLPLLATGIERLEPVAGSKPGAYGEVIIHADYTHSLFGALVLAAVFGGALAFRYGRRSGVILALVVMSHWVLDLIMHRADMPILPGASPTQPRFGFGLWQNAGASAALELILVVGGAYLYWRAAERVAPDDLRRARLCGGFALAAGLTTLALNVAGF
jgi:membrane-bound metal-dependent hydrolase YbcI (DUF457 family)